MQPGSCTLSSSRGTLGGCIPGGYGCGNIPGKWMHLRCADAAAILGPGWPQIARPGGLRTWTNSLACPEAALGMPSPGPLAFQSSSRGLAGGAEGGPVGHPAGRLAGMMWWHGEPRWIAERRLGRGPPALPGPRGLAPPSCGCHWRGHIPPAPLPTAHNPTAGAPWALPHWLIFLCWHCV